ncbi:MFS transporter [Azospirillum sp. A29]|jgi:sugar phosphate permease|uniref:MFS transporter n=1 Tax=Azospirillum sp. A29 TaxID=3160606 RepID=UPI00366D1B17
MSGNAKLLIAIWVMQFVNYADRVVVSFAGPSMMKSLSIDTDTFGIVLSSFSLGYLLSQIPGGIIADKWGSRAVVIIGPLFWALFTGLTGFVSTVAALIAARLLFGVSEGLSNAATYKLIGDNFAAEDRPRAMSIWVTALAIAPALTGPVVGMLLTSFGWHEVFLLLAIPALAVAAVNFALVPSVSPQAQNEENRATDAGFRSVLSEPSLWLICGAYGFWSIAYWGFLGWMPSYLALERHIDIKGAGILGGLPYLFGLCGGLAAGWAGARIGSRGRPYFLATVYLLACLALFGAFISATLALSVASLSIAGLFMYAGLATYGAVVLDLAPGRARAAYAGVVSTAGQIGGTLAPTAIGYLVKATGSFGAGFAFMSASLCIAAVCALALVPIKARQQGRIAAQVVN